MSEHRNAVLVLAVGVVLFLIALYGVHQGFLLPASVKRPAAATPAP